MVDVSPRGLFVISGVWITNTVVSTWIMMVVVLGAVLLIRRLWPMLLEWLIEFLDETVSDTIGASARPYLPFLGALALFIAMANLFGVVPWVTTPTSDISTTAALAIIVFFVVHYFGVRASGGWGYVKKLSSPIFMLPLEIIGQLSRTLSLALRLFGNMVSTDLIVAVIYVIIPLLLPLPLIGLGMITGVLQAYIFLVLATSYIAGAVRDGRQEASEPAP
jgi:F-type H+-transporting ATPase subunit a